MSAVIHPHIELKTAEARKVLSKNVAFKDSIQQSANLGALVSGLYSADYNLISRSLEDLLVEPKRAPLIPHFGEIKQAALDRCIGSWDFWFWTFCICAHPRKRNSTKNSKRHGTLYARDFNTVRCFCFSYQFTRNTQQ